VLVRELGPAEEPAGKARAELPRGGTSVLPERRVVAFYGAPQTEDLGVLGIGPPRRAARRLRDVARDYKKPARPILPAFELIAVIAHPGVTKSGNYSSRQKPAVIRRYLRAAKRSDYLLLLDIQPGRSNFPDEVKALAPFLESPNVGLALDPEWRMGPKEVPGEAFGEVKAAEVNRVSEMLSETVEENDLPDKLLVVHQFLPKMVRNKKKLREYPGVDLVLNSDGFGNIADKKAKYRQLAPSKGPFHRGLKLFYREDTGLMSPEQVLGLRPAPVDLVVYE
jgi:hypothetical protein